MNARLQIAPNQVNLNTMRILRSFDVMAEEKGIICEVTNMYAAYSVQKVAGDPGQMNLQCHSDQIRVYLNPPFVTRRGMNDTSLFLGTKGKRNREIFNSCGLPSQV